MNPEPSISQTLLEFDVWAALDVADGNASPATLRAYRSDVKQHLEWLGEKDIRFVDTTRDDLKAYRAWLTGKYCAATAGRKLVGVRRFYQMAYLRDVIPTDPGAHVRSPADRTRRADKVKWFDKHDLRRLMDLPNKVYGEKNTTRVLRDRCILTFMAVHGLRVCEVSRLNVKDLRYDDGIAGVMDVFGKGSKWRVVRFTEHTRKIVDDWLAARDLLDVADGAVFVTLHWGLRKGERPYHRITTRSIRQVVDQYLTLAGLKRRGISCHSLRHSFATNALEGGARLIDIARAMGHASVTTTQVYADVMDADKHNPATALDDLLM